MDQQRLFDPAKVSARQFEPVAHVAQGAQRYAAAKGMDWKQPDPQLQNDHRRGFAQAQTYERSMQSSAPTPRIEEAYRHATDHIRQQYDFMTAPGPVGMGIKHEVTTEDPYPSAHDMAEDLRQNRRIRTYATATTSAGGKQAPTLQAFDNDTNDQFRAVHDVFGHAATGRGFSRHGEEAAYVSHSQMFPKEALPALASETRGQNSYLNYRGDVSEFPEVGAKKVDMPDWAVKPGPLPVGRVSRRKTQADQKRLDV